MDDTDSNIDPYAKAKGRGFRETVRLAVRKAYQENGGNLALAANGHGVSLSTARRWKQNDRLANQDWEILPPLHASAPPMQQSATHCLDGSGREALVKGLLEDYLTLHQDAVTSVKQQVGDPLRRVDALSRLSQALDRTLRALGKASPELSRLAVASWVLERQAEFVKTRFPHHLTVFLEMLDPFGEELLKEVKK